MKKALSTVSVIGRGQFYLVDLGCGEHQELPIRIGDTIEINGEMKAVVAVEATRLLTDPPKYSGKVAIKVKDINELSTKTT
jgi:hypothetical protein